MLLNHATGKCLRHVKYIATYYCGLNGARLISFEEKYSETRIGINVNNVDNNAMPLLV